MGSISTPKKASRWERKLTGKKPLLHTDEDHRGIVFPHQNQQCPYPLSLANVYSQVDCFLHLGDALETSSTFSGRLPDYKLSLSWESVPGGKIHLVTSPITIFLPMPSVHRPETPQSSRPHSDLWTQAGKKHIQFYHLLGETDGHQLINTRTFSTNCRSSEWIHKELWQAWAVSFLRKLFCKS